MNTHTINYRVLTITSNTKEKECIKADTENNKLYQKATKQIYKQYAKLRKNKVNLNIDIQSPPKPNNYDRFIDYKKNNINKPCFKQSDATIYLYENGYVLNQDYHACDAQFAKQIKKKKKSRKRNNLVVSNNYFNALEQPEPTNITIINREENDTNEDINAQIVVWIIEIEIVILWKEIYFFK